MGQQHDFYLVQSGNLVPRSAHWRDFLACFQQPSPLRSANLDSSDASRRRLNRLGASRHRCNSSNRGGYKCSIYCTIFRHFLGFKSVPIFGGIIEGRVRSDEVNAEIEGLIVLVVLYPLRRFLAGKATLIAGPLTCRRLLRLFPNREDDPVSCLYSGTYARTLASHLVCTILAVKGFRSTNCGLMIKCADVPTISVNPKTVSTSRRRIMVFSPPISSAYRQKCNAQLSKLVVD